jgi:NAD(P)-dependent dehydrogenase (short-subunit alcohol dehydrogenase family)/rhamnose utilization protein RhaD (predicted bifunctional aldolase and dehydrogenase)
MNKSLKELIDISRTVGKNKTLVQGGGGNTSVKTSDGKFMYIKASGTALKDMQAKQGWRRVRLDKILPILSDKQLPGLTVSERETIVVNRLGSAVDDELKSGARPSVEAHLHAILDHVVIHLHAQVVGAFVNAKNGWQALEKVFKNEKYPPLWVPYVDPGLMLGLKVKSLVEAYRKRYNVMPKILFLDKHGIFVTDKTPAQAMAVTRRAIKLCKNALKTTAPAKIKPVKQEVIHSTSLTLRKAFFQACGEYAPVRYYMDDLVASFMRRKDVVTLLRSRALTPDELIYTRGAAIWVPTLNNEKITAKLKKQMAAGYKPAVAYLVKDQGLFIIEAETNSQVVKDTIDSSFFIRSAAAKMGSIRALTAAEEHFINNWEAEAFRNALVTSTGGGKLTGRIAIVTGAGSGLGRSIATSMARQGAMLCLADVDTAAAEQTARLIRHECPKADTMIADCDVTNDESVSQSFTNLLDQWGGLDILVNAAGVAPAYPLVDLPLEKWKMTLDINLTGYFLMAQQAARAMIAQGIGGSIINISSKSGIDASKNNTPYNATKAGELHMARGWAMELGQHNIRVNSVCPGNVFEGSKIWNPNYIAQCAKKYGITPDEVIPHYVSKSMLNREIKGSDIADAVVFLSSDQAKMITAQTLIVDAGQAMVR